MLLYFLFLHTKACQKPLLQFHAKNIVLFKILIALCLCVVETDYEHQNVTKRLCEGNQCVLAVVSRIS